MPTYLTYRNHLPYTPSQYQPKTTRLGRQVPGLTTISETQCQNPRTIFSAAQPAQVTNIIQLSSLKDNREETILPTWRSIISTTLTGIEEGKRARAGNRARERRGEYRRRLDKGLNWLVRGAKGVRGSVASAFRGESGGPPGRV